MKTHIIPAIMPERFDDIQSYVALIKNKAELIQIDIMDGKYAPEKTWPFFYQQDYHIEGLKKEDEGFPFWENLNYELDLMIERPEEQLDTWLAIGASRVVFHYASIFDWEKIKSIDTVIRNFTKIGLAVTIFDDRNAVCKCIDENLFDYVQVMGIAHIGYQGEPFEDQALDLVKEIRTRYPNMLITIDGGVSENTIEKLAEMGANEFVSGSGVFGGGDAVENFQNLESLVTNI